VVICPKGDVTLTQCSILSGGNIRLLQGMDMILTLS